jgi:hypothetical protein
LSYPAYQKVFNVGFRVVCEDAPLATAPGGTKPSAQTASAK